MLQEDGLYLWSNEEIEQESMSSLSEPDQLVLREILCWSQSYLLHPHPLLGRDGPVCPFTKPSLAKQLFFIATPEHGRDLSRIKERVQRLRQMYASFILTQDEASRNFLTFLIPLPDFDLSDAGPLDDLQGQLKNDFVKQGLMIGQFHPKCEQQGLWNEEFRPLKCAIPLLAIRVMVLYDLPFLMETHDHLDAYLATFAREIPPKVRGQLVSRLYAPRPELQHSEV